MQEFPHIKQAAISTLLRVRGWILPNYPLPPNEQKTEILRVVVRESFSSSISNPPLIFVSNFFLAMCDRLIEDVVAVTETLMVADMVDIEAYAYPCVSLTVNDKLTRAKSGFDDHSGKATMDKWKNLMVAISQHQAGDGVFKRGSC